ncbi:hypothetical protein G6F46_013506 [Rhizopus delemar]|nr:hypothetical protein G6F46_013506 [Rhizopus delemar]
MAVLLLGFAADLQHRRLADGGQHRPELGMGRPDGCAITPQSPAAQCYKRAREARHEFMTVEHLLLALLDNPSAQAVLKACGADAERLRQELEQAIEASVSRLAEDDGRDTQPTLGFQRVLQRHAIQLLRQLGHQRVQCIGIGRMARIELPQQRTEPVAERERSLQEWGGGLHRAGQVAARHQVCGRRCR